jgi:O-antigen ligase
MPHPLPRTYPVPYRQAAPTKSASNPRLRRLIPLVLVYYSFLLFPPEVQVNVLDVNLPSYRIVLLALSIPALRMMLTNKSQGGTALDMAVAFIAFWILLSFTMIYGFESGIVRGAGIMIDTAVPYLIARVCVKSFDDLRYFLILCLPGLIFAGGALALESLSGRLLVRPAFASIFGNLSAFVGGEATGSLVINDEYRLGLLRAYGPFPHPILAGVVMVGFLPLYYLSGLRSWPLLVGIGTSLTGFFALSSSTFLVLMITVFALLIYHLKRYVPKMTWWKVTGLVGLGGWTVHMVSQSGIISVLSRLTLTPHTAEYRTLIWEYGSASVGKHPWFGIGYNQWERLSWMGESVDAHFLLLAMRHGVIVPVLLFMAIVYSMIKLGMAIPRLAPKDETFAIGINICMVVYLVVGQTVNYFGSSNVVFMSIVAFLASALVCANGQIQERGRLGLARPVQLVRPPVR